MMKKGAQYPTAKVAIVGAGMVGSTTAYALMMNGAVSSLALIDRKKEKAEGEALDLMHCMQFTNSLHIQAGDDFALVKDAMVVIVTAGAAQTIGQSRSDLLKTNVAVFKEIIPAIVSYNNACIILVVTNPLDVLTYVTWKLSGFPSCRVFGTGTVLDTARLRYLMGNLFNISPKDITAYMLGEHGDSEFVWWSKANIAGVPLTQFAGYNAGALEEIYKTTKNAAYEIIQKKGSTNYAIALVVAKIVRAIILDQSRVFTVSSFIDDVFGVGNICLSLPMVVRQSGVCERLDFQLNEQELALFHTSAQKIRNEITQALELI